MDQGVQPGDTVYGPYRGRSRRWTRSSRRVMARHVVVQRGVIFENELGRALHGGGDAVQARSPATEVDALYRLHAPTQR